ncbi:MAG: response regulator [Chitinivibrionales bacterium]|nr:response regulator [Chitinivibrionales bacterium]
MKQLINFLLIPQIEHSSRETEFRLNIFYRLLCTIQLFLTLPVVFLFIFFRWNVMAFSEGLFFALTAFACFLTRKGYLRIAVHFFVMLIISGCLIFLSCSHINDSTFAISVGIIICGVFLTMKETVLWGAIATTSLLLIAWFSPIFTILPRQTLGVESITDIAAAHHHFSTSIILIWIGVFISIVFRKNFTELLDIIKKDNEKLTREIEDRKAAEQQIRSLNENLEQIVEERTQKLRQREEQLLHSEKMRAIGQLAGGIAHDFNNQLTGIISCADIIKLELTRESELYELADTVVTAAQRSGELIEKLLSFARKGKQQSTVVDIHSVIDHVISLLSHTFDKRIKIDRQFDAKKALIQGDPAQFQNILINLATNSRDAMPEGGALRFSTANTTISKDKSPSPSLADSPGEYIMLSVADTGKGIEKEIQSKIFEPFFTTKERGKGIGMGLAAVYGAVESNHGAVCVVSEPEAGAEFQIYIPLCNVPANSGPSKIHDETTHPARVLIIDDEDVVRLSAEKVLIRAGFDIMSCSGGKEALSVYENEWENIDVILLDMIMPELNGKETFRKIRKINPLAKVILFSGYSLDGDTQAVINDGACTFIQKPYNITELIKTVSRIASGKNK